MMFQTKKKKIKQYIENISDDERTSFDLLLCEYISGKLKSNLDTIGIHRIEIYIDWLDDIKCIGVQGKVNNYYVDIRIYQNEFCISCDEVEPDDDVNYPLESEEQLYDIIKKTIDNLK